MTLCFEVGSPSWLRLEFVFVTKVISPEVSLSKMRAEPSSSLTALLTYNRS